MRSTGLYFVVVILEREESGDNRNWSLKTDAQGDSYIAICPPALTTIGAAPENIVVHIGGNGAPECRFVGEPNKDGFLSRLEGTISANNSVDAERRALSLLEPILNAWAVALDIPVRVARVIVREEATGVVSGERRVPFPVVHIYRTMPAPPFTQEYLAYAALYAESLRTNTRLYEFLCLFKISEKIFEARDAAGPPQELVRTIRAEERFPASADQFSGWLSTLFPRTPVTPGAWQAVAIPEVIGKKFRSLVDGPLNGIRVKIAHALGLPDPEIPISYIATAQQALAVELWLPATRCIARVLLEHEFPGQVFGSVSTVGAQQSKAQEG